MKNPHFFVDGKPITVELPKPIPVTQRFNVLESVEAIKGRWLVIALAGLIVLALMLGVEIK